MEVSELKDLVARVGLKSLAEELVLSKADGRIKLFVIWKTLNYRGENRAVFDNGECLPLEAGGVRSSHVCAFSRRLAGRHIVVCVPRLTTALIPDPESAPLGWEVWGETELYVPFAKEGAPYRSLFTGVSVQTESRDGLLALPLGEILREFPVALLECSS